MDIRKMLEEGALQLGAALDEDKIGLLLRHKEMMLEWNKVMNLTAIEDEKDIIIRHFLDSLSVIPVIDRINPESLIDIGTGAGFPGIPLKIARQGIKVTLLDSLNKRINFLNELLGELKIDRVRTIHMRAEEAGAEADFREKYDVAVSRAVAQMPVLAEYCLPFVRNGGYFIAFKGEDAGEEVKTAQKAIDILGGEIEEIKSIKLPFSDMVHSIIIIKKVRHTPGNYPRKPGKPSKNPII